MKRILILFPVLLLIWGMSAIMRRPVPEQLQPTSSMVQQQAAPQTEQVDESYWAERARYDALEQHLSDTLDDSLYSSMEQLSRNQSEQLALEIYTSDAQTVKAEVDWFLTQSPGVQFTVYLKPANHSREELRAALLAIRGYAAEHQLAFNIPPMLQEDYILLSMPAENADFTAFLGAQGYTELVRLSYQTPAANAAG